MRPLLAAWLLGCAPPTVAEGPARAPGSPPTAPDTAAPDDDVPPSLAESPCEVTADQITCPHQTTVFWTGVGGDTPREVHWQLPLGEPPATGWPVAMVYQGSFLPAELNWWAFPEGAFGMWHQALLTHALLGAGYAVITPETRLDGTTYWDTNVPPFAYAWDGAPDHAFVVDLLTAVAAGELGPLDPDRLFATGISSGGYMTSRMALSYPGRFRALAIMAGSWATCNGWACTVPDALPGDHPPTLFLHGTADFIVPAATALPYLEGLRAQGTPTGSLVETGVGHAWIPQAPDAVVRWFDRW